MKIGVNTLFLIPGEVGGTETYLRQTLRAMAGYFPDVSLVLFTNRENDSILRNDLAAFKQVDFELLDFAASNRYVRILREQVELPRRVRRSSVDVLWSPGYTAPFFSPCPQAVTIPDMQYKTFPQDMTFLARLVTDLLVNVAVRRCGRVITISEFSRNEIAKHTSADRARIDVTPLAADPAFGNSISQENRQALLSSLLPVDRPYLLSVANSYPHKNLHSLIRAFGELEGGISHRLVIVGNPRLGEQDFQDALALLPDKGRVIRLQKLPMQELTALYQGCDAFVFPSLYEGFGLPVLEAMMAGVPVVAMKLASIPEVGGDCVTYADGGDSKGLAAAMLAAVGMTAAARRLLCNKASARASSFSWVRTAGETILSLRSVLQVS